jgi:histidinol-phosphate aminotransferase
VGYLLAAPETTAQVMAQSLGDYALNQAGIAAAVASYDDEPFLAMSRARIVEGRDMIVSAVKAAGLEPLPSATNFVFVNLGDRNAETFREKMAARNVLIRGIYGSYDNWSRVSMGRLEDVSRYVSALPEVLDELDQAPA